MLYRAAANSHDIADQYLMWDVASLQVLLVLMIISHFHAQDSETALHKAASHGHNEICQCLIEHDANVNVQDKVRDNPCQGYAL